MQYGRKLWLSVGFFMLVWPRLSWADADERHLELWVGYSVPNGGEFLVGGRFGLSDFVDLRLRGGARLNGRDLAARLETLVGYAFEVLTWVPEVNVGPVVTADKNDLRLAIAGFLGTRYYIGIDHYLLFEIGSDIDDRGEISGLVRLGFGF